MAQAAPDSIVLEEEIDPNYVPSESEVIEYAKWLGMDLKNDTDLFWVAKEGLMAPLPKNWKPCKTKDTEDIYYFNFSTGDSTWDHPCDGYYKRLYEEEKKKKEVQAKESSDTVRTRAKQDVDQLLGKGDKKKKKKLDTAETLSVEATTKKIGGSTVLGPLASLERKPLPGIQPIVSIEPTSRRRESSPLQSSSEFRGSEMTMAATSSFGSLSSTGGSDRGGVASSTLPTTRDNATPSSSLEFEPSDSKVAKSKKPLRLSSVIADSEDSKSDAPPSPAIPSRSSSGGEAKMESQRTAYVGSPGPAEAKKSQSAEILDATAADNDDTVSKLRQQIRRLESDVDTKTRQCDRFESEVADLERRLIREKKTLNELRDTNEDIEANFEKQIKSLNEHITKLEKQVEDGATTERQLRVANRELQVTKDEAESDGPGIRATDADSSADTELVEKILKLEQAHRRLSNANADLQEQLVSVETQYKTKLFSIQRRFDDLAAEHDALKAKQQKKDDDHAKEVATLKRSLSSEGKAVAASVPSAAEGSSVSKTQYLEISSELSAVKMERDALSDNCKRLQLSIASWETDCADKENRLQQARARANDLEGEVISLRSVSRQSAIELADTTDKARLLEMERSSLKDEIGELKTKLQTSSQHYDTALTSQRMELQDLLETERTTNKQSERKMRGFQEELIQLQRRLQEVKDERAVDGGNASFPSAVELSALKETLTDAEKKAQVLVGEVENYQRKVAAMSERNTLLQTEADRLREMLHANKNVVSNHPSDGGAIGGTRSLELENQLTAKRNELEMAHDLISSLRSQVDEVTRKWSEDKSRLDQALADNRKLANSIRILEGAADNLKMDLASAEKSQALRDVELLELRTSEERERQSRVRSEKLFEDLKTKMLASTAGGSSAAEQPTSSPIRGLGGAYHGEASLIELSIIVGKQQAVVAQLEAKLLEAEVTIKNLGTSTARPQQPTEAPPVYFEKPKDSAPQEMEQDVLDKSLLREMMLDFVRRRKPFLTKDHEGQQPAAQSTDWNAKIVREKKFVADARKQLNDEKNSIRLEQNGLMKRREAWKKSRNLPMVGGAVKSKDVVKLLNKQTLQLNLGIEQARRTQQWLDERERKLERLEELLYETSVSNDDAQDEYAGMLGKELDADATMIELEPFLPLQFSSSDSPATFDQENELPPLPPFFSDNLMLTSETNTYLQAKADEKSSRRARGLKRGNALAATNVAESVPVPTNDDRRVLQMRIQRDVDERIKFMALAQDHAG